MRLTGATIVSAAVLLAFAYTAYEASTWHDRSRLFAAVLLGPALVASVVQLGRELRRKTPEVTPAEARITPGALTWFVAFFASVWLFGFLVTIPAYSLAYVRFAGRESWLRAGVYAVLATAFTYVLFVNLLKVSLPAGALLGGAT